MSQALLTPHGRPYPFWGVDGGWERCRVESRKMEGRKNCSWYVKMNKKLKTIKTWARKSRTVKCSFTLEA